MSMKDKRYCSFRFCSKVYKLDYVNNLNTNNFYNIVYYNTIIILLQENITQDRYTVLRTTTGKLVEYTKAFELNIVKELCKIIL